MTAYGAIGFDSTTTNNFLERVDTPLTPVSVVAPVAQTSFLRYRITSSATFGFTVATPASVLNIPASTFLGSRVLPQWALDHRGYFANNWATLSSTYVANTPSFPGYAGSSFQYPTTGIPVNGSMSGQTREMGVAVSGKLVGLFYRPTMQLISRQYSDAAGNFTFIGLEPMAPNNSNYFVVALNNTPLQYDAVVHDKPLAG